MKVAIPVDRPKLERCIKESEQANNFSGLSALYSHVANAYNVNENNPIQPCVVKLRIDKWGIPTKTQKGKRGRATGDKPVAALPPPVLPAKPKAPEPEEVAVAPEPVRQAKSIYEMPTRSDIDASQSAQMCGCRCINIVAPAGDCPAKLTSTDQESVITWAEKAIEAGHKKGLHFSPAALRYFVRQFYDIHSAEHRTVCGCLQAVVYVPGTRMPVAIIPPTPKPISKPIEEEDDEELEEVGVKVKLAKVNLAEVEEELLD